MLPSLIDQDISNIGSPNLKKIIESVENNFAATKIKNKKYIIVINKKRNRIGICPY